MTTNQQSFNRFNVYEKNKTSHRDNNQIKVSIKWILTFFFIGHLNVLEILHLGCKTVTYS